MTLRGGIYGLRIAFAIVPSPEFYPSRDVACYALCLDSSHPIGKTSTTEARYGLQLRELGLHTNSSCLVLEANS